MFVCLFIDISIALSNVMVAATGGVREEFKKCQEQGQCTNIEVYKEGVGEIQDYILILFNGRPSFWLTPTDIPQFQ